jgi:hypothetical protein
MDLGSTHWRLRLPEALRDHRRLKVDIAQDGDQFRVRAVRLGSAA